MNLEEEEELDYGHRPKRLSFFESPLLFKIGCGIFIIAIFAFALTSLILTSKVESEVENLNSIVGSSETASIMDYVAATSEKSGCTDSFTISSLATCERECEREFCSGEFATDDICRGACYPIEDVSLEKCKNACVCCEARTNCLLKNQNDEEKCNGQLQECSHFVQPSEPLTHQVSDVCYSLFGMCRRTNFGFNEPIHCS